MGRTIIYRQSGLCCWPGLTVLGYWIHSIQRNRQEFLPEMFLRCCIRTLCCIQIQYYYIFLLDNQILCCIQTQYCIQIRYYIHPGNYILIRCIPYCILILNQYCILPGYILVRCSHLIPDCIPILDCIQIPGCCCILECKWVSWPRTSPHSCCYRCCRCCRSCSLAGWRRPHTTTCGRGTWSTGSRSPGRRCRCCSRWPGGSTTGHPSCQRWNKEQILALHW